jgi:hypothetical protein
MDPEHFRVRFFTAPECRAFTVCIDAEWSDERPGEMASYTPTYEFGVNDCRAGEVTISDDGLLSVMPRQQSAFCVVIRWGWTAQLPRVAVAPIRRAIAMVEAMLVTQEAPK